MVSSSKVAAAAAASASAAASAATAASSTGVAGLSSAGAGAAAGAGSMWSAGGGSPSRLRDGGPLPAALRLHGRVHVQGRDAPLDGPELRVRRPARVGQGLEDGLEARRRRRFFRLRLLLFGPSGELS